MTVKYTKLLGIGSVLVATILWGSTGTLQSLLPESREPLAVGALRLLFGALFLFLLACLTPSCCQNIRKLPWFLVIFAGIAIGFYNLFFFWAVTKAGIGVGTAITIGSAPVWVTLYEVLFTKQWPRHIRAFGQFISISGVGLLAATGAGGDGSVSGILLSLAAGAYYAAYSLATSKTGDCLPSTLIAASTFFIAALITSPVFFFVPIAWLSEPLDWGIVLTLGIGATGIAYVLYTWGLRHVAASTAVTLALAEPVTAWLLAMIIVGETATLHNVLGVSFILTGLTFVTLFPNRKPY